MIVKCAHEPCDCEVDPVRLSQGATHCCDACAMESADDVCPCGHQGCSHAAASVSNEGESVIALGEQYARG